MKVYYASRFERQLEIRELALTMHQKHGIDSTARWVTAEASGSKFEAERRFFALMDLQDINEADIVVVFSEQQDFNNGTGGRHVEYGYALARQKTIVLCGSKENVFHHLADFIVTKEDLPALLTRLSTLY